MPTHLETVIAKVNSYSDNLWENLDRVPSLPLDAGRSLLAFFVHLACQCQNNANINLGRNAILSLPHEWVCRSIQSVAEAQLTLSDEWEYRRLLELYEQLDNELWIAHIAFGLSTSDPEIIAAAIDSRDARNGK